MGFWEGFCKRLLIEGETPEERPVEKVFSNLLESLNNNIKERVIWPFEKLSFLSVQDY